MKLIHHFFLTALMVFFLSGRVYPQEGEKGYKFTIEKQLRATPVKNQAITSTCWSFSTLSFLESELLRMGKGEFDLSEMFIVRNTYSEKAKKYVRLHGHMNMAGGAALNDVTDMIKKFGLVPEEVYPGMTIGENKHIHGEMDEVFKSYLDGVIKNKNKKLTPVWQQGFESLLDTYLGKAPAEFTFKGKKYSPQSFAREIGINPDNYILVSSFTHHPFYSMFAVEVPDNWSWGKAYNLPLEEFAELIDHSVNSGYSIAWASDYSEKGFSWKNGLAVVPDGEYFDMSDSERATWNELTETEKNAKLFNFDRPVKEKKITQAIRQEAFDNYTTTDDHGMHILGIANDQNGAKFYLVKNSWGTDVSPYKGYLYASESYVLYKTVTIMVHKDAVPKKIARKLNF